MVDGDMIVQVVAITVLGTAVCGAALLAVASRWARKTYRGMSSSAGKRSPRTFGEL